MFITLQPFSQDYGLFSRITHAVYVNFIRERRDLQFIVNFERQILEKLEQIATNPSIQSPVCISTNQSVQPDPLAIQTAW